VYKPILCLDNHGVLGKFGQEVLRRVNLLHGTSYTDEDCTSFYFKDCPRLGEHAQIAEGICTGLMAAGRVYRDLEPYEGALALVDELAEKYDLWVITHVTPPGIRHVVEWFYDHDVPVKAVFPVLDPSEKLDIVRRTLGLVEDRAKTANEIAYYGFSSYLVDRPWNATEYVHPNVVRGSFAEIVAGLLA
jgi:5'(3')-deoxyribonucleotidase